MNIEEHISGEILLYDYDTGTWQQIAAFDDSNVESASTKRQCCADGAFEIGGVYGATLSLKVRLTGVTRNQLRSSKIVLRSRYAQEPEWEPVGEFWVTKVRGSGELFTITAEDGMLWTDSETAESVISTTLCNMSDTTLESLIGASGLTRITGVLLPTVTAGMQNVLRWSPYDAQANGNYCNEYLCSQNAETHAWEPTSQPALVKPYAGSSVAKSTRPRDFYRWAAELAGGFVTVRRDGLLCLRQFGMEELGAVEISTADIEADSADISDFQLWLQEISLVPEVTGVDPVTFGMADAGLSYDFDYRNHATLRYKVQSNPFLDGLCDRWITQEHVLSDAKPFAAALWRSFFNAGRSGDQTLQIRPFRATVHKPVRFELGQKIILYYRDLHETAETTYQSTATSVSWTFKGGHAIACGGENARVAGGRMITKSDRVSRELLYRTR